MKKMTLSSVMGTSIVDGKSFVKPAAAKGARKPLRCTRWATRARAALARVGPSAGLLTERVLRVVHAHGQQLARSAPLLHHDAQRNLPPPLERRAVRRSYVVDFKVRVQPVHHVSCAAGWEAFDLDVEPELVRQALLVFAGEAVHHVCDQRAEHAHRILVYHVRVVDV